MSIPTNDIGVNISTSTIIRFFLVALLIVSLYFISDVVLVLLAAIILASATEPVIRRLKKYKINRITSVVILYILLATFLVGIFVFFLPRVLNETTDFLKNIPTTISLEDIWSPISDIGSNFNTTSSVLTGHRLSLIDYVKGLQTAFVGQETSAIKFVSSIFGGLLSLILIVVVSFYLAVKQDGVDDFLRIITPIKHYDYIIDLWKRSQRKIGLWLQGQVILGIIVGVLVYIVLLILGIPHAFVLALLVGLLEIIPVFGPIIASVPAIIISYSEKGIGTAVLVLVLYIIIQQLENHVFVPLVVRKIVGISPIIVILSIIIGVKLAGVLGALIAVPLSAAFMEYINDIEKYKKLEIAERESLKN